jgi:hypothetical protein
MRIKLHYQPRFGAWHTLVEGAVAPFGAKLAAEVAVSEADRFALDFWPEGGAVEVQVLVGDVVVASTLGTGEIPRIEPSRTPAGPELQLEAHGHWCADWVGLAELSVMLRSAEGDWRTIVIQPLAVTASKIAAAEFDRLYDDLQRHAPAVLFDVYGKTHLGLRSTQTLGVVAPLARWQRLRATVQALEPHLHRLARQPAAKQRTTFVREQAYAGAAVTEATLAEISHDPSLLSRQGAALVLREQLREQVRRDYHLPEHQTLADVLVTLRAELAELRERMQTEIAERDERARWRMPEEQPRVQELRRTLDELQKLDALLVRWTGWPFLPPGRLLTQPPASTPLFRQHPLYHRVFRVLAEHGRTFSQSRQVPQWKTRIRSLPVLYEWWCALRVVQILSAGLTPIASGGKPFFLAHAEGGTGLTINLAPDQEVNFSDRHGFRVRLRYQPEFRPMQILSYDKLLTPDLALELYPAGRTLPGPALTIILDAKYTVRPHADSMQTVAKYGKIGDPHTGAPLTRQVWVLTPTAGGSSGGSDLPAYCTVDNRAFWSPRFNMSHSVVGAIQTRPVPPRAFDPLRGLLLMLLERAGARYVVTEPTE